jgi:hypothetical protein
LGNDLRIHQHQIGVLSIETVFLKNSLVRVDYRQGATRRIAGGHSGAVHNRQLKVGGDRSCCIEDLTAPCPDDHLNLVLPSGFLYPFDFGKRTFSAEWVNGMGHPRLAEGAIPGLGEEPDG